MTRHLMQSLLHVEYIIRLSRELLWRDTGLRGSGFGKWGGLIDRLVL